MSLASVKDRPNTINCRKLIGRASLATHLFAQHKHIVSDTVSNRLPSGDEVRDDVLIKGLYRSPFRGDMRPSPAVCPLVAQLVS